MVVTKTLIGSVYPPYPLLLSSVAPVGVLSNTEDHIHIHVPTFRFPPPKAPPLPFSYHLFLQRFPSRVTERWERECRASIVFFVKPPRSYSSSPRHCFGSGHRPPPAQSDSLLQEQVPHTNPLLHAPSVSPFFGPLIFAQQTFPLYPLAPTNHGRSARSTAAR